MFLNNLPPKNRRSTCVIQTLNSLSCKLVCHSCWPFGPAVKIKKRSLNRLRMRKSWKWRLWTSPAYARKPEALHLLLNHIPEWPTSCLPAKRTLPRENSCFTKVSSRFPAKPIMDSKATDSELFLRERNRSGCTSELRKMGSTKAKTLKLKNALNPR